MTVVNPTQAHATLCAVFDRFAGAQGPAYHHVDGDLGFAALHAQAQALAQRLALDGDSPVFIWGHKHSQFLVAYWAALLAGRTVVPVESDASPDRLAQIAAVAGAGRVLIADPLIDALPLGDLPFWRVTLDSKAPGPMPARCVPDTKAAYILFSSGTTGQPKGIAVSYANLADFVGWAQVLLDGMAPALCISGNVRYCFDVSLFEMWFSWLSLRPISALDHRALYNTGALIGRYRDHRLGTWVSTPSLALHWVRDKQFNAQTLPDLHTMLFCGEVLSKSLLNTLWQRFPDLRIINTYGPTECTVAVTAVDITRAHLLDARPLPIGRARQGTQISGATGSGGLDELVITGRSVGLGYLGDAVKQAKSFPMPATYMTGDWGQAFDDMWYFEGRKDREVKLHGHRIDLNTVEAALRAAPGVEDAVVDVHPNNRGLRAFVLGPTTPQALEQTARHLAQTLAAPMVPRFWYGSTLYPLNANSKLDRTAFIAQLQDAKPLIFSPPSPALVSQSVPEAMVVAG